MEVIEYNWLPFRDHTQWPKKWSRVWLKRRNGKIDKGIFAQISRKDGPSWTFMFDGFVAHWASGDEEILKWALREEEDV